MEASTSKAEPSAGGEWKNGAIEAAASNSTDSSAPSKEVISNKNSSPTAKTESALTYASPKKRRKVNHGNLLLLDLAFSYYIHLLLIVLQFLYIYMHILCHRCCDYYCVLTLFYLSLSTLSHLSPPRLVCSLFSNEMLSGKS
jgi:hypothetical protein